MCLKICRITYKFIMNVHNKHRLPIYPISVFFIKLTFESRLANLEVPSWKRRQSLVITYDCIPYSASTAMCTDANNQHHILKAPAIL